MSIEQYEKWFTQTTMSFHDNPLSADYVFDKVICWRFSEIRCDLIKFDKVWMDAQISTLEQYWNYVQFYRKKPTKLDTLLEYVKEVGEENSAEIFKKIHKDYLASNPDTKYKPLYQEENPWRVKYDAKKKKYSGFKKWSN